MIINASSRDHRAHSIKIMNPRLDAAELSQTPYLSSHQPVRVHPQSLPHQVRQGDGPG